MPVEAGFFALEAAGFFAVERFAEAFERDFDAPDFRAAGLRDDEREDFEDFFFEAPRAAEDFRPVFFAPPARFDLPAALFAAFFFFMATGCSSSSRASPEPGSYNSDSVE